jgi:hypothetical protein
MSAAEFGRHIDYFNKYGRLTPVRMYDAGPALITWRIDRAYGGKTIQKDWLPNFEPDKVATVEDVIKEFGGVRGK